MIFVKDFLAITKWILLFLDHIKFIFSNLYIF